MFESRLNSYSFVEHHFIVFVVDRHGPSDDFLSMRIDCILIAILFQTIIILSERKTNFTFSYFVALLSFFRCRSISKNTYACKYFQSFLLQVHWFMHAWGWQKLGKNMRLKVLIASDKLLMTSFQDAFQIQLRLDQRLKNTDAFLNLKIPHLGIVLFIPINSVKKYLITWNHLLLRGFGQHKKMSHVSFFETPKTFSVELYWESVGDKKNHKIS